MRRIIYTYAIYNYIINHYIYICATLRPCKFPWFFTRPRFGAFQFSSGLARIFFSSYVDARIYNVVQCLHRSHTRYSRWTIGKLYFHFFPHSKQFENANQSNCDHGMQSTCGKYFCNAYTGQNGRTVLRHKNCPVSLQPTPNISEKHRSQA